MERTREEPRHVNDRLLGAALIALAVLPFVRTLGFGYVMDEVTAIRSNATLNGWSALGRVWGLEYGSPDAPFVGLYRPLTMMLFAIVWNLGGGWPLWFHLFAIALHALATWLVWRLLARGLGRAPALIAAAWFAVHPIHVEAVANVANSSETLVAIWTALLALHLLSATRTSDQAVRTAIVSGALFAAALLSKESGAMAPLLGLLCVWGWRARDAAHEGSEVRHRSRWLPIFAVWALVVALVALLRTQALGGPMTGGDIAAPGIDAMSAGGRVWAMLSLGPTIARLLLWPAAPNPSYGPSIFASARTALALATVAALLAFVAFAWWRARRGDRRPLVAGAWIAIAFLPASNLLVATGQILAERTLYVPSIGVAMFVGLIAERLGSAIAAPRSAWRVAAAAAAVVLVALLARQTWRSTAVWRSHEGVYRQMVAADSANYRGWWSLAIYEGNNGRMANAIPLLERAYALFPRDSGLQRDYAEALFQAGRTLEAQRDTAGALRLYQQGIRIAPAHSALHARLREIGGVR
jgi:hypothetical protein